LLLPLLAAAPSPSPDQVRRAAEEVFARPEFDPDAGRPNWLLRALAEAFQWLGTLYGSNPVLFWVLLVGCLLLLALLVGHIVYVVVRSFGRDAEARRRGPASEAEQRRRQSAAYRDEARRRAAGGEYTEAIRCLFLALVYRFDETGRVGFPKSATNREYLQLLGEDLPVRGQLAVFVDTLDEHWYGQRPADRSQFERCEALYDRLLAAV
jgi:hypothetical protein